MIKTLNTPFKSNVKDSYFETQFKLIFNGFYEHPQTMKELSIATGIDRANICRYCKHFRKNGVIAVYKKSYCSVTKHLANYYTTNPTLFPKSNQLTMF